MNRRCSATALLEVLTAGILATPISIDATVGGVEADNAVYQTHCASCHGPEFEGGFGPPLRGKAFQDKWAGTSAEALLAYIQAAMPPATPGSLPPESYAAVHQILAQANNLPTLAD